MCPEGSYDPSGTFTATYPKYQFEDVTGRARAAHVAHASQAYNTARPGQSSLLLPCRSHPVRGTSAAMAASRILLWQSGHSCVSHLKLEQQGLRCSQGRGCHGVGNSCGHLTTPVAAAGLRAAGAASVARYYVGWRTAQAAKCHARVQGRSPGASESQRIGCSWVSQLTRFRWLRQRH